jgi:DNA modification methylase
MISRMVAKTRAAAKPSSPSPPPWPAAQVESWPIDRLIPYARNARTHSDAQIAQVAGSMRQFGWTVPVLCDEAGRIIAGHGRVLAARLLNYDAVPVMVARGWSETQKQAYTLVDNQLALNAGWDFDLLRVELTDLQDQAFDISMLGFPDTEVASIFGRKAGLTDPDEVPEPPANPVTVPGDAWILGRHRIVCGDSTDPDTVAKALNGATPHLMVTDPPYGVEYDANWRNEAGRAIDGTTQRIKTGKVIRPIGARAVGKVLNDDRADWREAWELFPGDVAYVWHAGTKVDLVAESLVKAGFMIRAQIVWAKNNMVISRGHYHPQHEPLFYAVRKSATGHWVGGHKQTTLWQIDKPMKSETGHSTQKPVECMLRPIENNSRRGDQVYDPFVGSGTTIIAAEMAERRCCAIELNPAYVDVTVQRWQAFTGEDATRQANGKVFRETEPATTGD